MGARRAGLDAPFSRNGFSGMVTLLSMVGKLFRFQTPDGTRATADSAATSRLPQAHRCSAPPGTGIRDGSGMEIAIANASSRTTGQWSAVLGPHPPQTSETDQETSLART